MIFFVLANGNYQKQLTLNETKNSAKSSDRNIIETWGWESVCSHPQHASKGNHKGKPWKNEKKTSLLI